MEKHNIVVIFTCFNRKEKTAACIQSLVAGNPESQFQFIVVDDNSTDGTEQAVRDLGYGQHYLKGSGDLYWAGGMRKGIGYFLGQDAFRNCDYVLLVNDDVAFYEASIDRMVAQSQLKPSSVMVGMCCNSQGGLSYGTIKFYKNKLRKYYYHLDICDSHVCADSFNCNCVLLPAGVMRQIGNFDEHYSHNFADFDYGVTVRRNGFGIFGTDFYVGVCNDNEVSNTWRNSGLPIRIRLKKKEHPKGLPFREHFYFLKKNLGLGWALRYVFTPYIRIFIGK